MMTDTVGSPGPPPDPAPAARRRRKRRLLVGAGVLLLLLGLLVALLPTILSSGWGRSIVEREGAKAAGMHVALGDLDVGWSDASLHDLVLRYGPGPDAPVLLRVGEVHAPAGITTALGSRYDLGTVRVLRPEVRLDLKALSASALPAAQAPRGTPAAAEGTGRSKEEAQTPPFSLKVEMREGTLLVVDAAGKETRLGTFSADLTASRDAPCVLDLALDGGPAGRLRIRATSEPFSGGRALDPSKLAVLVEAVLESLDLAPWREAACALGEVAFDRAGGVVSGTLSGRVVDEGVEDGKAALSVRGLVLEGPELGEGIRIEEREARVEGGFRAAADGTVEVREGTVTAPGLSARGSVTLPTGVPAPGAPGSLTWGPALGRLELRGDLHDLLPRLRALGVVPPQVDRTSGRDAVGGFTLDLEAAHGDSAQRWTARARLSDVQVAPGRGRPPLDEPAILLDLDLVDTGKALRFDTASLRSGSAVLVASGSWAPEGASDFRLKGQVQIARAASCAALLDAEPPGTFSGTADVDLRFARAVPGADGGGDGITGSVGIQDLLVVPPGKGAAAVRADRLDLAFRGVPAKGKDEVDLEEITLKGAGLDLRAKGTVATDLSRGSLAAAEADADLARLAAVADALGEGLGIGLAGAASWKGPFAWTGDFDGITAGPGDLAVEGLVATIPGERDAPPTTIREQDVKVAVDAASTTTEGGTSYTLRRLGISSPGIEIEGAGSVAADGRLDLRCAGTLGLADLARRAVEQGILAKDPAPRGALALDLTLRGDPADPEIGVNRFETQGAEADLSASGTVTPGGAVDLSVKGGGGVASILGLLARAGLGPEPGDEGGSALLRLRAAAPDGETPLQVTSELRVVDLSFPGPGGGTPWNRKEVLVTADGSFDRKAQIAAGTVEIRCEDGSATVRGSAVIAPGKRSVDAAADLDLDLAGLCRARPDLLPLPDMVVGTVKGTAKVAGPLREPFDPAGLAGTASLGIGSVRTEPFEVRDAAVEADLKGGTLHARSVAATVNEGKVAASAALGLSGAAPKHYVALRAGEVRLDRALGHFLRQVVPLFAVGESGTVTGRLKMDLRLEGEGGDWEAVKPDLHGQGSLEVSDAAVTGSGVLGGVLKVLETLDLGGGAGGLGLSSVGTAFTVHDGRVWNERLTVDGQERSMVLRGSTSFEGDLDYTVGVRVPKALAKRVGPLLDGDGNLPLALRGKISKPKVKPPDVKRLLGGAAGDLLKKKMKDLLGGEDEEKK